LANAVSGKKLTEWNIYKEKEKWPQDDDVDLKN
jgi:hypothetical protein